MMKLSQTDIDSIATMAPGANKRLELERQRYLDRLAQPVDVPTQPEWTAIDGIEVLAIPGATKAALPATGKRNAAKFVAFEIETGEELAYLKKSEVRAWLIAANG